MSGIELVEAVLSETGISCKNHNSSRSELFGQEYWAGWILAYYQWESGNRFEDIVKGGLPLSKVFSLCIFFTKQTKVNAPFFFTTVRYFLAIYATTRAFA